MTPAEQENIIRAQCRRCTEEIKKAMSKKPKPPMGCNCQANHQKTPPADCAAGRQPPGVRSQNWPPERAVWSGIVKERGMIFNAEMVRAILDGRKTQTRRIVKLSHERGMVNPVVRGRNGEISSITCRLAPTLCPFGEVGDRIWVREAWNKYGGLLTYRADYDWIEDMKKEMACHASYPKWSPSIHMPRWASRITLEIAGVRVERLHAITLGDICKEFGCGLYDFRPATYGFTAWEELWKSIYGEENWQANPWVWVIEFKRVEGGTA